MKLIYSGFDTIDFAIRGAVSPDALKHLDQFKQRAIQEKRDLAIDFDGGNVCGLINQKGARGGYNYLIQFGGELGCMISIKENINRNEWNGFATIRAIGLAVYGWEQALAHVFSSLKAIGFSEHGISLNRVDYAMDFLNAGIEIDPKQFVAHARVKKSAHKVEMNAYSHGQTCESVTLGKMPNRQVIVYDKRAEVIAKKKREWFEIWNLNPSDKTQSIHRVEVRLGKNELKRLEIRTIEDLKHSVNAAMTHAVNVIRFVIPIKTDRNISRWPNHELWNYVQSHIKEDLLKNPYYVSPEKVKAVIKAKKASESKMQVLGNMANYSVFSDMHPETIKQDMMSFAETVFAAIESDPDHPFWKTRTKTKDRFIFLET